MEIGTSIYSLPDEILIMILKRTSYVECNSFMRTCKRYNDLLKSCHSLWRIIFQKTAGKVIYNITASQSEVNWICDMRQYLSLRHSLIDMIVDMSPKHFCEKKFGLQLDNVKEIFAIALSNNTNYYCTVSIVQDFMRAAIKKVDTFKTEKPYTLTELHYARIIVRFLIHVLYTLKWVQHQITNQLTPEIVLNFFVQWLDPAVMYSDEEVHDLIKDMIKDVDRALLETVDCGRLPGVDTQNTCPNGIYGEKQVLSAISSYLYKQKKMTVTSLCNLDTLNVVKTIKLNTGHRSCLAAIYQAIARGFGITTCNMVAFPNHLYLEWRPKEGYEQIQVCLDTGELMANRSCPFADNAANPAISKYCPKSFLLYIIAEYRKDMGGRPNWYTDNAKHLVNFIINNHSSDYSNFFLYLSGFDQKKLSLPFNMEYIHAEHINCIHGLLALNRYCYPEYKDLYIKHHSSILKYSIGLICYNKAYGYIGVICGWDLPKASESVYMRNVTERNLFNNGVVQPFYYIVTIDQTVRYVSQDNLILVTKPSRIYEIEDVISKEFSHFNGFFYEPNTEKQAIYPDDMAISNMYASKSWQIGQISLT